MTQPGAERISSPSRGAVWILGLVALGAGIARGLGLPAASDAGFHLLRAGNDLLAFGLDAWASPVGGDHAPLLGALGTALGALFTDGSSERAITFAGSLALGAAAALVGVSLLRTAGWLGGLLGVALLLAPDATASSFPLRPDSALAGILLLVAWTRHAAGSTGAGASFAAAGSVLCSPWAWPGALFTLARSRRVVHWLPWLAAAALVAGTSLALPPESRGEILRGLRADVTLDPSAGALADILLRAWGFGLYLLVPAILAWRVGRDRLLAGILLVGFAWTAIGASAIGLRDSAAVWLPTAVWLFVRTVAHTAHPAAGASNPPRGLVFAWLLPIALFLTSGQADERERFTRRQPAARETQIARFLSETMETKGGVLTQRTGALAALSDRAVTPLVRGGVPTHLPRFVVLSGGRVPRTVAEHELFLHPTFLARFTPLEFRRGRALNVRDVLWVRTADTGEISPDYARELLSAWGAEDVGDDDAAFRHFREALAREPNSRGLAAEGLGLLHEREGRADEAELYFAQARRDPYTVRARGHLVDRELARGGLFLADTLVTEAVQFNPHLAEVRGTRARLFFHVGLLEEPVQEAEASVRLHPEGGRLLANLGIYLWRMGRYDEARATWHRAARADASMLAYLGDFDRADEDLPPPPPVPHFTDVEFAPFGWRDASRSAEAE